jgi:transcriptional regulator with XRE-family HTH domain
VPNLVLRSVRHALNLSQEEFAARIRAAGRRLGEPNECSKRHVQRWESGQSATCRPVYRRALESATGRAFRDLGFDRGAQAEPAELDRRDALGAGVGLAVLLAAPGDPERAVGAETVAGILERTARFRRLDEHLGGADTYRLYATELEATAALLERGSYTQPVGRALLGAYAQQAQQAGWAAFDAGWHAQAERLQTVSLEAARRAGDAPLAGNALALLAYQAGAVGRPSADLAAGAYREAGPGAPGQVRALLLERLAWAHATAGHVTGIEQALDLAAAALAEPQRDPVPDWAAWADARELRIISGRCWSEARRPLRAVPVLESVLAEYEDSHARDKALYLTWLAGAYADAGEVEQAAAATARALDLSAGVASVRPAQRAAVVLRRLEPYRALPAVRELLEQAAG